MTDWLFEWRMLVHNGRCIVFPKLQADLINVLLIAEGRLKRCDLFRILRPYTFFSVVQNSRLKRLIVDTNQLLAPMGWKIMALKALVWMDKAECFKSGIGWVNEVQHD